MTTYEWIASLIGILQCALIAYGLRTMLVTSERRNQEGERRHAEYMEAHKAAHAESMQTHKASHAETMAAHAENMAAHAESMTALKELIARTGRAPAN